MAPYPPEQPTPPEGQPLQFPWVVQTPGAHPGMVCPWIQFCEGPPGQWCPAMGLPPDELVQSLQVLLVP